MLLRQMILAAVLCASAGSAYSQAFFDPATLTKGRGTRIEGSFTMSEVAYENNPTTSEFERKIIGASLSMAINPVVDFIGQFGLILDGKIKNIDSDGDGFNLGFGLNGSLYNKGHLTFSGFGLFVYQKEDYEIGNAKIDYLNKELHLGGIVNFKATKQFGVHGGLVLVPMSDGEMEVGAVQGDFERDDMMYAVLGATIQLSSLTIRPQLSILGEETFTIGVSSSF